MYKFAILALLIVGSVASVRTASVEVEKHFCHSLYDNYNTVLNWEWRPKAIGKQLLELATALIKEEGGGIHNFPQLRDALEMNSQARTDVERELAKTTEGQALRTPQSDAEFLRTFRRVASDVSYDFYTYTLEKLREGRLYIDEPLDKTLVLACGKMAEIFRNNMKQFVELSKNYEFNPFKCFRYRHFAVINGLCQITYDSMPSTLGISATDSEYDK